MPKNRSGRRLWALGAIAALCAWLVACGGGGESLTDRLLVVRDGGIVELSLASGEERMVIPNPPEAFPIEPAVSPDGREVAYVVRLAPFVVPDETPDLGMDVYVAAVDGSNPRLVQEHQSTNEQIRSPAWLPDGESLLVVVQQVVGREVTFSLERVDLASGSRTPLVDGGFRPAVSPDGSRMAYVTQDEDLVQTLWLANIDGSDAMVLAGPDDGLGNFNSPRFSPDGTRLAFGASEPGGTAPGVREVGSARYAARSAQRPRASSDAASAYNGLPMDIWVMELDGGSPRVVADLDLDLPSLAWSGDSARIFVLGGAGLFAVDPADESDQMVAEGTFHGHLDWLAPE